MSPLEKLCKKIKLTAQARLIKTVSAGNSKTFTDAHKVWSVTLTLEGSSYVTRFRTGMAIAHPSAADVIGCLVGDVHAGRMNFAEYCSEFGADRDSRQAHATWKACRATVKPVTELCGRHLEALASAEH